MLGSRLQKFVKVCLICFLCVPLTGCWNRREIETLSFVLAAGIDPIGDSYLLSTQVANTEAMAKNAPAKLPNFFVFTTRGKTIFDAIRNATHESPSKLFWSHTKVLVLGENMAQKGIKPVLEFFARDAEERRNFLIVISHQKANEIISADVKTKNLPAIGLMNVLEGNYKSTSETVHVNLNDLLRGFHGSASLLVPAVKIVKNEEGKQRYYVSGAAVLKEDKFVSYLTPVETRGVLWTKGKVRSGIVVTPCLNTSGKKAKNRISFEIYKSSAKMDAEKTNGKFSISLKVKESGNLAEAACVKNEVDPNMISKLENSLAKEIEKEINKALMKSRKLNTDVFGFGDQIHRDFPEDWKKIKDQWDKIYSTIPVKIHVDCHITGNALLQYSGVKK
jgi:spore germination protein KC